MVQSKLIYTMNTKINSAKALKIGIAASDYRRPSEKYVLKPFNKKFHPLVEEVLVTTNEAMLSILNKGANETMNNFNKQNIGVA